MEDCYENLVVGIVQLAIRDYQTQILKRKKAEAEDRSEKVEECEEEIEKIRRFFFSKNFARLTRLDAADTWQRVVKTAADAKELRPQNIRMRV